MTFLNESFCGCRWWELGKGTWRIATEGSGETSTCLGRRALVWEVMVEALPAVVPGSSHRHAPLKIHFLIFPTGFPAFGYAIIIGPPAAAGAWASLPRCLD